MSIVTRSVPDLLSSPSGNVTSCPTGNVNNQQYFSDSSNGLTCAFIAPYEKEGVGVDVLCHGKKLLALYDQVTFKFETDLQTPILSLDFKQICDKYQNDLYAFYYAISQYLAKLEQYGQVFETIHHPSNKDEDYLKCLEMKDKIKVTCAQVGETHSILKDDRETVYTRREHVLQSIGVYGEKSKEYCDCYKYLYPKYIYETVLLEQCLVCFGENVSGIRPTCCEGKQEICINCLKKHMEISYKTTTLTGDHKLDAERLLAIHYSCPFCRRMSCLRKFLPLLLE